MTFVTAFCGKSPIQLLPGYFSEESVISVILSSAPASAPDREESVLPDQGPSLATDRLVHFFRLLRLCRQLRLLLPLPLSLLLEVHVGHVEESGEG